MKGHLTAEQIALHAGGDLGKWERWQASRHLRGCEACREETARFASARQALREAPRELPEGISEAAWKQMAAEMHANIRVGLEAGQIVNDRPRTARGAPPSAWNTLAACAAVVVLVVAGVWLERPATVLAPGLPATGEDLAVVSATADGIEIKQGKQALGLLHNGAQDVTISVSAAGQVAARYTDSHTGQVMIQNVVAVQ